MAENLASANIIRRTLDFLHRRKRAYQLCFGSPAGNEVLVDLVRFCRATKSTWGSTDRHHARYEGRREVFLRITEHMHLTTDQLFALYNGRNILQPEKEDDNG